MSTTTKHHGIIVCVDGSPTSAAAAEWAAHDAALRKMPLTVVNVLNPSTTTTLSGVPMPLPPEFTQWQQDAGRRILHDALTTVEEVTKLVGPLDVASESMVGPTVPILAEMSKDAEMVVVGSHGRGALARLLLGSVSTGLIHHAHCPVAVIPHQDPLKPHPSQAPVVVGIDGSAASDSATAIAFDEASRRGVELVALHAWSDTAMFEFRVPDWSAVRSEAEELLAERLAGWQERYPDVDVCRVVECDRPAHQLVEQSGSAQLVVVGSHGRGGFTGMLLGSVSTAVVHAARTPVIVARQP